MHYNLMHLINIIASILLLFIKVMIIFMILNYELL